MVTTCRCLPGNVLQRCTSRTTVLPYWWLSMATVLSSTPWWTWRILYAGAVLTMAAAAFACAHSYNTAETPIAAGRPDEADLQAAEDFGRRVREKLLAGDLSLIHAADLQDELSPEASVEKFVAFFRSFRVQQAVAPQSLFRLWTKVCVPGVVLASVPVPSELFRRIFRSMPLPSPCV